MYCIMVCVLLCILYLSDVQKISVSFHVIIPIIVWEWNDYCRLAIKIYEPMQELVIPSISQRWWYVCLCTF